MVSNYEAFRHTLSRSRTSARRKPVYLTLALGGHWYSHSHCATISRERAEGYYYAHSGTVCFRDDVLRDHRHTPSKHNDASTYPIHYPIRNKRRRRCRSYAQRGTLMAKKEEEEADCLESSSDHESFPDRPHRESFRDSHTILRYYIEL